MPHKVFWCVPTGEHEYHYSRTGRGNGDCPSSPNGYHRGERTLARFSSAADMPKAWPADDDPIWPAACDHCGATFTDANASRSSGSRAIMKRADTGEEMPDKLPVGAVFENDWVADIASYRRGPDGRVLIVVTPGGHWEIDSRASNCTMPQENEHRCWVRHGRPEDGTLHVDKNGHTCAAGAGSIVCGNYHGFLHNGHLTDGC